MSWQASFVAVSQALGTSSVDSLMGLADPGARRALGPTFGPDAPRRTRALALAETLRVVGSELRQLDYRAKDFT